MYNIVQLTEAFIIHIRSHGHLKYDVTQKAKQLVQRSGPRHIFRLKGFIYSYLQQARFYIACTKGPESQTELVASPTGAITDGPMASRGILQLDTIQITLYQP